MSTLVHIETTNEFCYPSNKSYYSPSLLYPEYKFDHISTEKNNIYDMVRNCLKSMNLDAKNYGTASWNPLGDIIKKGDTVLVKPNLVNHLNYNKLFGEECLVTHPSVIRAVIDYVLIALDGTGKIILGDAPVQSCNFSFLINNNNYNFITEFYKNNNIDIKFEDFRLYNSEDKEYVQDIPQKDLENMGCCTVNIGLESAFDSISVAASQKKLRITNYDPNLMTKYHHGNVHEYLISKSVLEADVVINIPKPKTHRKAGITGSLKNMIGINAYKHCLPHHMKGARYKGGDEYLNNSLCKNLRTINNEYCDKKNIKSGIFKTLINILNTIIYQVEKIFRKDDFTEGSWYGNDTIWRTINDINRIVLYADKSGNICEWPQRKMFIIADMIISGEGEGPLMPSPKDAGIIAAGFQSIAFDKVIASIMGFDYFKIPSISKACYGGKLRLPDDEPLISSNIKGLHMSNLETVKKYSLKFKPSSGWINNIEIENNNLQRG